MNLLTILSLDKHNIMLKNVITKLDQELAQLIKDYTSANRYARVSFALRQDSDYAELLGNTVEQLRNSAFTWRETLKPQFIQSVVVMRSFCTTYIQYFNAMTQELSASTEQGLETNATILLELYDETLAKLNKVLQCFAKLTTPIQAFMLKVAENKKNLTEHVLPNVEKIIEQVHGNLDENFKNLKITLMECETSTSNQTSKEDLDRLLDLVKEYLALKPKMAHYQATKDAFQKLLPPFLLENRVQNLCQGWEQFAQSVTQEKEKLAVVASHADSNKSNEKNLAREAVENIKTQDKQITIPTALQESYAFLEKLYAELSYLEKNLKRYELEIV